MESASLTYLREIRASEYETIFRWINQRDLRIQSAPYNPVHWHSHLEWIKNDFRNPYTQLLVIAMTTDDSPIGVIRLDAISLLHRSAEFSIRIGEEGALGLGLGTDALNNLIRHSWLDLGLQRLSLSVFSDNHRAIRAYEKAGFVREGVLQRAAFINGNWKDIILMAILK